MSVAILATGDEIVHGDTLNTNGLQIAQTLCSEGIPIGFHMSCSDKKIDIINSLSFLAANHDCIIIIGGLGPTSDDMTRFALAEFISQPLIENPMALDHIKKRLQRGNMELNEGNRQQCLFPEGTVIFPNPHGTAVGAKIISQDKRFYLLPGPPRECLPMFHDHVFPDIKTSRHSDKVLITWLIFGLAESEIASKLEKALLEVDCRTGYRLDVPYIEFKVRCKKEAVLEVKQIIDPILAPHIISQGQKASKQLHDWIASQAIPITILDEATGGQLQSLLCSPQTHHLLDFSGRAENGLTFYISGLKDYWQQKESNGKTRITIQYQTAHQEGGETHELPYRSPLVVHYAAEWLSFRLFHLINQLHQGIA